MGGGPPPQKQSNPSGLCERYLREFTSPKIKDMIAFRTCRSLLPWLGRRHLHELTREDIEAALHEAQAKYRANTVHTSAAKLQAVLSRAARRRLIARSPAAGIEKPPRQDSLEQLTAEEPGRLLAELEKRSRWNRLGLVCRSDLAVSKGIAGQLRRQNAHLSIRGNDLRRATRVKFVETARHPPSRATLIRLVGVAELGLSWAEVPGHGPPPAPASPPVEVTPPKGLELNWFIAPGYDPIRMVQDLGRFLGGAGGHVEQAQVYLDPQSAAAYLAMCRHPGAALLRASLPLDAAAKHISAAYASSDLRVIVLGAGDATLETQLVQHLLETAAAPRLELCLLDVSQPLLAAGFQNASEGLSGRSGVAVWGMQADFHHLGEYPPLRRAPKQQHLFCLLGGTLANLDHEPRFFRHSLRGEPGDLLLVDLQLACSSPANPEEIKKRDRTWTSGVSPLLAAWLGGPIWRHGKDVTNIEFRWELDTQSPIPGSYALEAIATVQARGRDPREFSMYRFRRYEPSGLTQCLRELGWHELAAPPYEAADQPSSLQLFVAHP